MMAIDSVPPNLTIIGISCPNRAYKQENRCEVTVHEIETFLDGFIKGWLVQKREVEVGVEEIKVDAMEGEVHIWKDIF